MIGPFLVLCLIAVITIGRGHDPGAPDGGAVIPVVRVNVRRAVGDARLLFVATAFPVLFILVTGLLAGSPREPVGLVHPPARLLQLVNHTDGLKAHVEASRATLDDDILRGRVVAGLVTLPAAPGHLHVELVTEGANTSAVQARTDVVALLDLMTAEGTRSHGHRRHAGPHRHPAADQPLRLRRARRPRALPRHHRAAPVLGTGRVTPDRHAAPPGRGADPGSLGDGGPDGVVPGGGGGTVGRPAPGRPAALRGALGEPAGGLRRARSCSR